MRKEIQKYKIDQCKLQNLQAVNTTVCIKQTFPTVSSCNKLLGLIQTKLCILLTFMCSLFVHDAATTFSTSNRIAGSNFIFMMAF